MIDSADEIILLIDSSKFNKTALHKIHVMDVVDTIITNNRFKPEEHTVPESVAVVIS